MNEIFESSVRTSGDFAGVFEFDGDVGYFYLYDTGAKDGSRIVTSVRVISGAPDFSKKDVAIEWDQEQRFVGLMIKRRLWAAFDCNEKLGAGEGYVIEGIPSIPLWMAEKFDQS